MSEEVIDVLDERGLTTGVKKRKSDVHRDGNWHRSVHVWIATPERRLLIQLRSMAKENFPGLWDISAAGHVSAGESAIEAALREVREELGLEMTEGELHPIASLVEQHVLNRGTYIDNEFHDVFLAVRELELSSLRLQNDEVADIALVAADELPLARMVPHEEEYALVVAAVRRWIR